MKSFDPWNLWPLWHEILLFFLAAGGGVWAWLRVRQAQSWPSAQGRVSEAIARAANERNFKKWIGELTYSYVVDGEYYSGFHQMRAHSEKRAEELVTGWKDRMVIVRYSPAKHDRSVLLKSDQPGGQLGN
ncbi:MAG: DUF3592 domain-containing protein [Terriglobales bacterium]